MPVSPLLPAVMTGTGGGCAPEHTKYVMFGAPRNLWFALSEDVGFVPALTAPSTLSRRF